jgi:hypothetical protein
LAQVSSITTGFGFKGIVHEQDIFLKACRLNQHLLNVRAGSFQNVFCLGDEKSKMK